MGLFFTNFHVLKTATVDRSALVEELCRIMKAQGFSVTEDGAADATFYVSDPGSKWISLCSDMYESISENVRNQLCFPLAKALSTPLLLIACFDSDFTYFNLIDTQKGLDAWARAGEDYYSDPEETEEAYNASDWKGIIDDLVSFEAALKKERVFSEGSLDEIEPLLGMAKGQGCFITDAAEDLSGTQKICFSLAKSASNQDPPTLVTVQPSLSPCKLGKNTNIICALNQGGASTGLGIAFEGNYIENDELRFENVCLEYELDDHGRRKTMPIELTKRHMKDGRYIYYAEAPDFQIPEKVDPRLKGQKREKEEFKRSFLLRFTPVGNERKVLDICVVLFPLANHAGLCSWCVWHMFGSKEAYIANYNDGWKQFPGANVKLLDINDYDL